MQILGFGEAPKATAMGYVMTETVFATEDEIAQRKHGDFVAVKGARLAGSPGMFEFAIFVKSDLPVPAGTISLAQLYRLWDELGNVLVTDNGEYIDEPFLTFHKGSRLEDVWRWFESRNPRFVVGQVMQGIRLPDISGWSLAEHLKDLPAGTQGVQAPADILDHVLLTPEWMANSSDEAVRMLCRPYLYVSTEQKDALERMTSKAGDVVIVGGVRATWGNCDDGRWAIMPLIESLEIEYAALDHRAAEDTAQAARQFFQELSASVETIGGIAEVHGPYALADVLLLQNAMLDGKTMEIDPAESKLLAVVQGLPSSARWLKSVVLRP